MAVKNDNLEVGGIYGEGAAIGGPVPAVPDERAEKVRAAVSLALQESGQSFEKKNLTKISNSEYFYHTNDSTYVLKLNDEIDGTIVARVLAKADRITDADEEDKLIKNLKNIDLRGPINYPPM